MTTPRADAAALPLNLVLGGHAMTIRTLQPDDAGRLLEFFASHTPETIHHRYGYAFTHMTPERAAHLVTIDPLRDAALGAFETAGDGGPRLIAIGRYCLAADGRSAETAFVVHEERRRLHLASTLLELLRAIARERGLDRLIAQVQHDNVPMLSVFRRAGAATACTSNDGVWFTLPVQEAETDAERRRRPRKEPRHEPAATQLRQP